MSHLKLFNIRDLDLTPVDGDVLVPVVNAGYSSELGAGIGVFENCSMPWTVTCDEVLFIKEGDFTLRVGEESYHAGSGDILWIPKDTPLVYEAKGRVTFFYAVHPVGESPSTAKTAAYPTTAPSSSDTR